MNKLVEAFDRLAANVDLNMPIIDYADKLTQAFVALGSHITMNGQNGPNNGIDEVAAGLGMIKEDNSDGFSIETEWKLFDGEDALTLSYVAEAVEEDDDPVREHYRLERSGSIEDVSEWSYSDGVIQVD